MSDNKPSFLTTVNEISKAYHEYGSLSLSEYSKGSRVEPLTFIDKDIRLLPNDEVQAIMQTALSVYCGMYLQAVNIAGNVQASKILNQFSTDNSYYQITGPLAGGLNSMSLDSFGVNPQAGNESANNIDKPSNLAVGKILQVPVSIPAGENGKKNTVTIPVTVKLLINELDEASMVNFLTATGKDNTIAGRFRRWRAGELSLADYILCLDLIESDRKALLNDKNGTGAALRERKRRGLVDALLTGESRNNIVSAINVITKSTSKRIEVAMRGKFSRPRDVEKFFDETNSMLLFVVDAPREIFHVYTRGISDVGTFTFDDISKNITNPNGVDINDVMKSFRLGKALDL